MENDTEKSGTTRRRNPGLEQFHKWTGRVFTGALLVGALVFDAPWKITLVVAYAFASSMEIIPPSITRSKWTRVFLIVALLVAWPVWLLLPSDPGDYKPFVFVEEQAQFEEEHGVPADQDASAVYMRLLEESDPNDRTLPSWIERSDKLVLQRPWRSEEYPEIARWLDERQSTIEALKSLGEYSQCRFPMEPMLQALDSSGPRLRAVRTWAHLLTIAANRRAAEGDTGGALELYALTLRIADHHIQQSDLSDYLVGLAVERMAFGGIDGIAADGSPAPDELAIMDALTAGASHEWAGTWRRIMRFECLLAKNTLCRVLYEVNPEGRIRYSRSSFADYKGIKSPYRKSCAGKLLASGMWVLLPKSPWKAARPLDARYAQFSQIGQADTEGEASGARHRSRFRANHEYVLDLLMDLVEPTYHEPRDIHMKGVAARQACRIILILRQYKDETGRWPASLDDVAARGDPDLWTDPLNGGSFAYQPAGQAFRLYSKGKNAVDEGGTGGDDISFRPARTQNKERGHASPEPE